MRDFFNIIRQGLAFMLVLPFLCLSCSRDDGGSGASGIEYEIETVDGVIRDSSVVVSRPSVSLTVTGGSSDMYEISYTVDGGREYVLEDIPMGITVFFKCDETPGLHSVGGAVTGKEGSRPFSCSYVMASEEEKEEKEEDDE